MINTSDNQIKKDQNNDQINEYDFDANGNLIKDATGKQFLYDAENHQKQVKDANNVIIGEYLYDGEGKRVKKISSTEITVFVYNGGGTLVAEYSTAIAQTPQVSYLTADHLGSARVITNQNGAVTTRKDYMAFGDEASSAQRTTNLNYDSSETRKGYTGYEKDSESGLEFAQARYYNSTHGRFTSVDPLTASASIKNPQTFNRYSYVLNNPINLVDPSGLIPNLTGAKGDIDLSNNWSLSDKRGFDDMRFREWVRDPSCSCPLWVPKDVYATQQTEESKYPLITQLEYQSREGMVRLDPSGPRPGVPQGWYLDGVAVGQTNDSSTETEVIRPNPPGENNAESTATDTPPMIMSSIGDPRRNLYIMYQDFRTRRIRGQSLFGNNDPQRHRWATRQSTLRWGSGTARTFGVLNEIQGFIWHDAAPLASRALRCYQFRACVSTRPVGAFEFSDLVHNEEGITEGKTIINNQKPK